MSAITLRRAVADDAEAFARLMSHPQVFGNLMQLPYPKVELWRQMLGDNQAAGKTDLNLVAERDGRILGSAGLHPAGHALRRRHAMMLGISIAHEAQRQGVGHALMTALMDYADNWAQVLRVELTVFVDNAPAIALYRKHGFETEGRHRGYALRDGVYMDVFAMARWHPRPPDLQPA
jgi:L-phenylalanine/L-methionine N-acetyltransferase